jgi:hypothetical protein
MVSELYDALRRAGVDDDTARAAAKAVTRNDDPCAMFGLLYTALRRVGLDEDSARAAARAVRAQEKEMVSCQ